MIKDAFRAYQERLRADGTFDWDWWLLLTSVERREQTRRWDRELTARGENRSEAPERTV